MRCINNAIAFLFAASVFAMIGIEASGHHGSTHSGTQEFVAPWRVSMSALLPALS
jgi:hypothetical protein